MPMQGDEGGGRDQTVVSPANDAQAAVDADGMHTETPNLGLCHYLPESFAKQLACFAYRRSVQ